LAEGTRKFHVWIISKRLGLSGKLDLLIDSPEGLFPVDFKMRRELKEMITNHASRVKRWLGFGLVLPSSETMSPRRACS
jgi:hypothetical protein